MSKREGGLDGAVAEARRSRQAHGYDPRREARDRARKSSRQKLDRAVGKVRMVSRLWLMRRAAREPGTDPGAMRARSSRRRRRADEEGGENAQGF